MSAGADPIRTERHARADDAAPKRQVWLKLGENVDVAVDYDDAKVWTEDDFAKVFLASVYGAKKREAREWGKRQVAERDAYLAMIPEGVAVNDISPNPRPPDPRDAAPVQRCEACGIAGLTHSRLAILRDGEHRHTWILCPACASDFEDFVHYQRQNGAQRYAVRTRLAT